MALTRLEEKLQQIVSIPSITHDRPANKQVLAYVEKFLRSKSMHVTKLNDAGFGIMLATSRPTKTPKVLLVAHADVVTGPPELFKMTTKPEILQGRGVWDMKYAIAGYLELVDTLGDTIGDYDFGIAITSDEETRNQNVAYLLSHGYRPKSAVLLDGGQSWQLESAAKGAWTTFVTVQGKAAHGSRPWEGESASLKMLDLINEVRELFTDQGPESHSLNVSLLNAGQAPNQLPVTAGCSLDIRAINEADLTTLQEKVIRIYEKYNATWQVTTLLQPVEHDLHNEYYQAFAASVTAVTGEDRPGLLSHGASEASSFLDYNIPCIVSRPTGGGHHGDSEWIDRKSLAQTVPILQAYLRAVCLKKT